MELESLSALLELTHSAGRAVMTIYGERDFGLIDKADGSPVTLADKASHGILTKGLRNLIDKPVLSEEGNIPSWSARQQWNEYWLIDPLDGTREFIKRNGEFTVNVALIQDGAPLFGIVYAPAMDLFYYGGRFDGAFRQQGLAGEALPIRCAELPVSGRAWRLVGSRSFASHECEHFLSSLPLYHFTHLGSSLKFCRVAEGEADLYPRFGPTYEWDTAAAQAVVEGAGGQVLDWFSKAPLGYNRSESLLNPPFMACSNLALVSSSYSVPCVSDVRHP